MSYSLETKAEKLQVSIFLLFDLVWSLKTGNPIYAFQAHGMAITQMNYDTSKRILLTMGKDKRIIFWKLPDTWINEALAKFEKEEIQNINDKVARLKMQKTLSKKDEEDDSSDDSLNGWDIRP